jgi:hypothetical protein
MGLPESGMERKDTGLVDEQLDSCYEQRNFAKDEQNYVA